MQENFLAKEDAAKIRAFFAINPPKATREALEKIIEQLREEKIFRNINIKWTKTDNLHITLSFLGNISAKQQTQIIEKLEIPLTKTTSFSITCTKQLSWFPKEKPRLIIINPKPTEKLIELENLINQQAIQCGIPKETRPFFPHITLGRIKNDPREQLNTDKLPQLPPFETQIQFHVNEIMLFRSDPDPQRNTSKYTPIKHFSLA